MRGKYEVAGSIPTWANFLYGIAKTLAQNEDMYTYIYIYFIVRKGGSDPPLSGPHLLTQLVPLPIFKMFFPPLFSVPPSLKIF